MAELPLPVPDVDSQPFWDYCNAGELRAQRCLGCGRQRYPVRPLCPHCTSFNHEWAPLSGKGTVYSYTVTHQVLHPGLEGKVPHVAILVVHRARNAVAESSQAGLSLRGSGDFYARGDVSLPATN